MRTLIILAVGAVLASSPTVARAPAGSDWPASPREFADRAEIERTAAAFPNSMGLQRRRLAAALEARDRAAALDSARRLAAAGAGLSPASRAQVEAVLGAEAMRALNARFDSNAAPFGRSERVADVPPDHRLIEGIALAPSSADLYFTSVVDRRMVALRPGGGSRRLDVGETGSLLGAAFDPRSRRFWVASAVLDETPRGGKPFNGLIAVDPAEPRRSLRIPAPAGAVPGDVAVAADGTVYASDGLNGGVYACRPGCTQLRVLIRPGRLFSAQGMAVSRSQRWLYVADRRYGLAAVERSSGRIFQVVGRGDMMLDGIDGLVRYGDDLIATQTAYAPQRIVRLRLSRDGLRVTRLDLLERANPEWGEVTLAAERNGRLLYVAGAQWERFGEGGKLNGDAPLAPTAIRALKLR